MIKEVLVNKRDLKFKLVCRQNLNFLLQVGERCIKVLEMEFKAELSGGWKLPVLFCVKEFPDIMQYGEIETPFFAVLKLTQKPHAFLYSVLLWGATLRLLLCITPVRIPSSTYTHTYTHTYCILAPTSGQCLLEVSPVLCYWLICVPLKFICSNLHSENLLVWLYLEIKSWKG